MPKALLFVFFLIFSTLTKPTLSFEKPPYPSIKECGQCGDQLFDQWVPRPYEIFHKSPDSPEVLEFTKKQNNYTKKFISQSNQSRLERIKNSLQKFSQLKEKSAPHFFSNGIYYTNKGDTIEASPSKSKKSQAKILLRIQDWSKTEIPGKAKFSHFIFSPNKRFIALEITHIGAHRSYWQFYDSKEKRKLSDIIRETMTSIPPVWSPTSKSFYYSFFPFDKKKLISKVYEHRIGTAQSKDQLIFEAPKLKDNFLMTKIAKDLKSLIITSKGFYYGPTNLYIYPLEKNRLKKSLKIYPKLINHYSYLGNIKDVIFIKYVGPQVPRGEIRMLKINLKAKNKSEQIKEKTLIPQDGIPIEKAYLVGERIFVIYTVNQTHRLSVFNLRGKLIHRDLQLNGFLNHSGSFSDIQLLENDQVLISFQSYFTPRVIANYDLTLDRITTILGRSKPLTKNLFARHYRTVKSTDGTTIPITILNKKGAGPKKLRPTYLYFNGSSSTSLTSSFNPLFLSFIESFDARIIIAAPRGGAEKGRAWIDKGRIKLKKNTFSDIVDIALSIIKSGHASPKNLILTGKEAGGLGALIIANNRPDLFAAIIPKSPYTDMLRYHLPSMRDEGISFAWDYSTAENLSKSKFLRAFGPIHNINQSKYPATMVFTKRKNAKVNPTHSFEFITALQKVNKAPVALLKVMGHGAQSLNKARLEELFFLERVLSTTE